MPPVIDASIAAIARADAMAAADYARCQQKHAGVVSAYDALVAEMARLAGELAKTIH